MLTQFPTEERVHEAMAKMLINISTKASCFVFLLVVLMPAAGAAFAQIAQPDNNVEQAASQLTFTVTASATTERVRFTAPSNITSMRIEVFSENAERVYDSNVHAGNLFDWQLLGGQSLTDGNYLCVVTVQSLSGKVSRKLGTVSVAHQQLLLRSAGGSQLAPMQKQTLAAAQPDGEITELIEPLIIIDPSQPVALTAIAHDGNEGQLIRSKGALSFRVGDFFSGNDLEQMRLSEAGNLGIGTSEPKARLDVAGTIRAERVLIAKPKTGGSNPSEVGSAQAADAADSVQPLASGTGTQNQVAKWIDGAGTLGDSTVTEVSGRVGIGTTNPGGQLHIFGTATQDVFAGMGPDLVAGPAFNYGYAGSSFGRGAGFFNVRPDAGANPPNPSLRFATANVQRMIVTNTGDVGIGITAPTAKLDVTGTINALTQYNIGGTRVLSVPCCFNTFVGFSAGDSNTSGGSNSFFGRSAGFNNNAGADNAFFGFKAGNVNTDGGHNTAIGSAANFGSGVLFNATAIGSQAQVDANNSLVLGSIAGVNGASDNTKVGIGVTAPLATLHVVSFSNTAADNTATFEAPTIGSNQSHIHWGTTGDWYIRSAAGAGKVVLQDTGGNVGIGTASPVAKLDVRDGTGASGSGGHLQIGAPIANADDKIIVFGDSTCALIGAAPCVSIGEEDVDNRLVLRAGSGGFRFKTGGPGVSVSPNADDALYLGESSNRWKEVWAVNGTIQTSDVRLKRGIINLKYGLSQVMQLRPVSFQWKNGDNATHLGLIAQEVDAVMPEAVQKSADANAPLGMNYSTLIPVLIKAIQEQQVTLDRAQAEIKTLRTENEALSKRIVSIELTSTSKVATSTPELIRRKR